MHKIFIPSSKAVKLRVCNLTSVSFRGHFLVFSRAEHVKLVLLPWSRCRRSERSVRCSFVSVSLNDYITVVLQATGPAVVLSRQYPYKTMVQILGKKSKIFGTDTGSFRRSIDSIAFDQPISIDRSI